MLVLLLTDTNKLLAEWQGPYPIIARLGRVVYEVDIGGSRRRKRRFNINMLREWVALKEDALLAEDVNAKDDDIVLWERNSVDPPTFNEYLSTQPAKELQVLLRQFSDVLGPEPGRTHIIEHCIDTDNASPIKLPPYRLPHAYCDAVNEELEEMEKAGTLEPSLGPHLFSLSGRKMGRCVCVWTTGASTPFPDKMPLPDAED